MSIHCGIIWGLARAARDRAVAAVRADPYAQPDDAIAAIVLAAATSEAFINELTAQVVADRNQRVEADSLTPSLCSFADALVGIEEAWGSPNLKYSAALRILSGATVRKGTNPYQDFATLVKLRNDIMHLKPQDKSYAISDDPFMVMIEPPKYIRNLQRRRLAQNYDSGGGMSWLEAIQTAEMASWACDTALGIILAILDLIPDAPARPEDPDSNAQAGGGDLDSQASRLCEDLRRLDQDPSWPFKSIFRGNAPMKHKTK